jgi:hypothetical protein
MRNHEIGNRPAIDVSTCKAMNQIACENSAPENMDTGNQNKFY